MSDLVPADGASRALALPEDELLAVLGSSLYPGAKPESIKLVLGYCRAAGLDPLQKPVHIVPMPVKTGRKNANGYDETEMRDVVMPGIGLYRTQASRTGQLAGIDEPEFGDDVPMPGVESAVVPVSCRVTVYRFVHGMRVGFTALEYWLENYATARRDSLTPNAMWKRRPRGQLAKCAEAQALRKAFPELGSQPTADETVLEVGEVGDAGASAPPPAFTVGRKEKPAGEVVDAVLSGGQEGPTPPAKPAPAPTAPPKAAAAPTADPGAAVVGQGEVAYLRLKATAAGVDLAAVLAEMGGLVLERLTKADFAAVKARLQEGS
jgi:phage recombination protein Bet